MFGLGTIINTTAIILGGIIGMLFGNKLSDRHQKSLHTVCGISVLFIGIAGTMEKMIYVENGLLVSKGTLETDLPDVENMSLSSAATKLGNMGFLVYEDPTGKPSKTVEKGNVIGYRDYAAGDEVAPNTEIYLVVSLGNVETQPASAAAE